MGSGAARLKRGGGAPAAGDAADPGGAGGTGSGATDGGTGGPASPGGPATPCLITWTGAITGTAACSAGASTLLALMTAPSIGWLVNAVSDTHTSTFAFQIEKFPAVMTYVGGTMLAPSCTASVKAKASAFSWNTSSRPQSSGVVLGDCSITFTSLTDESTRTSSKYVAHGTATANLVGPMGMPPVTMTITF